MVEEVEALNKEAKRLGSKIQVELNVLRDFRRAVVGYCPRYLEARHMYFNDPPDQAAGIYLVNHKLKKTEQCGPFSITYFRQVCSKDPAINNGDVWTVEKMPAWEMLKSNLVNDLRELHCKRRESTILEHALLLNSVERRSYKEQREWETRLEELILDNAEIVFGTISSLGLPAPRAVSFHTIICDEACQASELETVIALTAKNLRRLVLIGDPQQLPPTVAACQACPCFEKNIFSCLSTLYIATHY